MELQRRATVYAAIGGVLALMGAIVLYASQDNPQLEMVGVELAGVEVMPGGQDGKLRLESTFLVSNPSETTFTVSLITYDLFANGALAASGRYSTADIAMPGRAVFYPGAQIPLTTISVVEREALGAALYDSLGSASFRAEGVITAESAWSIVEKDFST